MKLFLYTFVIERRVLILDGIEENTIVVEARESITQCGILATSPPKKISYEEYFTTLSSLPINLSDAFI